MSYSLYLAAPKFTPEDEEKEQAELSSEEKLQARADLYGTKEGCEVSEEQIGDYLRSMQDELLQMPDAEKKEYLLACERECEMTTSEDDLKLFLRSENYDANSAACRIVRYWERRVRLFGSECAFERLSDPTLVFGSEDDWINFAMNYISAPGVDNAGRSIILGCPKKKTSNYNRESTLRVLWVKCHEIIRDASDDCNLDLVGIVWMLGADINQLIDRKFQKALMNDIGTLMPVKMSALHICHFPTVFGVLKPVMLHFFGSRIRQRFVFHSGLDEEIFTFLSDYGIPRDALESEIMRPAADIDPSKIYEKL